jgi:hypothetical protein
VLLGRDPWEGFERIPYSLHPYQYGYSAPTLWTDPSGLTPDSDERYRHRYWVEITLSRETYAATNEAIQGAIDDFETIETQREWTVIGGSLVAAQAVPVAGIVARISTSAAAGIIAEFSVDVSIEMLDGAFSIPDLLDPLHNVHDSRRTLEEWRRWMELYYVQVVDDLGEGDTSSSMTLWIEDRSSCYHGDDWTGQPWSCMCTFGLQEEYVTGADWSGIDSLSNVSVDDFVREIDKHTYRGFRDAIRWDGYSRTDFGSSMYDGENRPPRHIN